MFYSVNNSSIHEPNVETLAPFQQPLSELPTEAIVAAGPAHDDMVRIGFAPAAWYLLQDEIQNSSACVLLYWHASGATVGRLNLTYSTSFEVNQSTVSMFSVFDDQSFLVSTAAPSDVASPPSFRINQIIGATPAELWASHERKLARESTNKAAAPIRRAEDAQALGEAFHNVIREFYVQHGLFSARPSDSPFVEQPSSEATDDIQHAGVLDEIENIESKRPGWGNFFLVLGISLLFFMGAGAAAWSWRFVLMLIPIMLFHELGHYIAMKIFRYQNLRMFFIPLFGAAVSGRHYNVPGWKKVIVSLAGPVPGIVLGGILGIVALVFDQDWLLELSLVALFLNGFNLLPFLPFDGGWVMHAVLFSRHPSLDAAFRVLTAAALIAGGLLIEAKILPIIGVFMLFGVPMAYRLARIAAKLRNENLSSGDDEQTIPPAAVGRIVGELRTVHSQPLNDKLMAQQVFNVYESINANPPNILASLAILFVHGASFFGAVVFALALVAAQHGLFATAVNRPQYDFLCGSVQTNPPNVLVANGLGNNSVVVATFFTSDLTERAFREHSGQIPAGTQMRLFGNSVLLALPADNPMLVEQWFEKLGSKNAQSGIVKERSQISITVLGNAPNQAVADTANDDLEDYFAIVPSMDAIAPWSPLHEITNEHRRSRRTWRSLHDRQAAYADPKRKAIEGEYTDLDFRDRDRMSEYQKKLVQQQSEFEQQRRDQMRQGNSDDIELIDIYEQMIEIGGDAALYDLPADKEKEKENAADAKKRLAIKALRDRAAKRLGRVGFLDDKMISGEDRFSCTEGYAEMNGLQVRVDVTEMQNVFECLPAIADWLCQQGCGDLKYEIEVYEDDE